MQFKRHPTLEGEIDRDSVNTASFTFAEPENAQILAPVPLPPEEINTPISNPRAIARQRPIGAKSRPGKAARRFAMQFIGTDEYKQLLWDRLRAGTLSPAVEVALMAYAWGRPTQKIDSSVDQRMTITVQRPW